MTTEDLDSNIFPTGFFNVGGKRFDWVFQNKPRYVEFTQNKMKNCTGFFATWKRYCENKRSTKLNGGRSEDTEVIK